jgi:hypothetical protein
MKSKVGGLTYRDPQVLEKRSGGGSMMVFGSVFFAAGCIVVLAALGAIPAKNESGAAPIFTALFGLPFLLVGLGFMLGRGGVIVDLRRGLVIKWWGLLAPIKRTEFPLDGFKSVTLKKEVRGSGKSQRTVYAARMEGDAGLVELDAPQQYEQGRLEAEELAKFLNLPMTDYTSGVPLTREPDKLDESVRERARRTGEAAPLPPPPMTMKTKVIDMGDTVQLEVPPPGFGLQHLLQLLIPAIFVTIVLTVFIPAYLGGTKDGQPNYVLILIISLCIIFPILIPLLSLLDSLRRRILVTASTIGLKFEQRGLIGTKTVEIPGEQLEELTLAGNPLAAQVSGPSGPEMPGLGDGTARMPDGRPMPSFLLALSGMFGGGGITARSDTVSYTFGQGLAPEEARYLHALLMRTLTR